MAEKAPENGSVIDFERLSFQGEGDRPIKQINDYLAKTNQRTPENHGELFRCIFTSIAFGIKRTIDQMEGLTGKKTGMVYMLGGGSRNSLLCQWTADLLNVPVRVGMYDAASLGNLVSQLKAGGEIRSFDEGRQILSKSVAQSEIHPRHSGERDKLLAHYVRTREQHEQGERSQT
jgi:sugar (pentulose or hexulose) kinase